MEHETKVVEWFNAMDWIQAGSRIAAILAGSVARDVARRLIRRRKIHRDSCPRYRALKRAAISAHVLRKLATIFIPQSPFWPSSIPGDIHPAISGHCVCGHCDRLWRAKLVRLLSRFFLSPRTIGRATWEIAVQEWSGRDLTLRYVQVPAELPGQRALRTQRRNRRVTSSSRGFAYRRGHTIALEQDIAPVIELMRDVGAQLRNHSVFNGKILEDLDIAGIESWTERGITLRARIKVRALEQSDVKREYLMRLKHAFDQAGIRQPRSTVTIMEVNHYARPVGPRHARRNYLSEKAGRFDRPPAVVAAPALLRFNQPFSGRRLHSGSQGRCGWRRPRSPSDPFRCAR